MQVDETFEKEVGRGVDGAAIYQKQIRTVTKRVHQTDVWFLVSKVIRPSEFPFQLIPTYLASLTYTC
jgi:hypothetical protein